MNKTALILLLFALSIGCNSTNKNEKTAKPGNPKFGVQPEIHNFGTLESGEVVSFSFKITNLGDGVLKIDSIDNGCGCIETHWPDKKLHTNESEYLEVVFNSAGEWGNIYKPIVLYTNTKETEKILYISAKVNNQLFK